MKGDIKEKIKTVIGPLMAIMCIVLLVYTIISGDNSEVHSIKQYQPIEITSETTELNLMRNVVYEIKILPNVENSNIFVTNKPSYACFFKNNNDEYTLILYQPKWKDKEVIVINYVDENNNKTEQKINLVVK